MMTEEQAQRIIDLLESNARVQDETLREFQDTRAMLERALDIIHETLTTLIERIEEQTEPAVFSVPEIGGGDGG